MKTLYLLLCCQLLTVLSAGCAPKYQYHDQVVAKTLPTGQKATTRVSASVETWRNSGVDVIEGATYRITANGKWRTYPTCNFTGPDGIGLYKAWCDKTPIYPTLLEGYSHSTLIGKVGEHGKIFAVGADYTFKAQTTGTLFFRINDTLDANFDNEGFVDVDIIAQDDQQPTHQNEALLNQPPAFEIPPTLSADNQMAMKVVASIDRPRTALVIGNSDYLYSPLKNPVNDAQAMAASLERLGFDVTLQVNANQQQMEEAIDGFGRRLAAGNHVALFYYAGHGVQVDGENYLIPVDAKINRQSDVRYKAVNMGQVLGTMGEAEDNLNIVILDACRDNPLPRSFRGGSRGLARVEGPKGTIIGFATSPGSVAADGEGDNGIYTKHLLANMNQTGLSIEQVFKKVLQGVDEETQGQQIPWTESSFTGDFSFLPD